MAYAFSVTQLGNNITVNPRNGNNITIAQTGTQVSINTNATLIQSISMANTYKGDWVTGTAYKRGDTVKYAGNVWLALNDFTSSSNPISDSGNWTLFSSSETTSTYNTVTALTSIVAAPTATLSFKHPSGLDSSNVLLSTSSYTRISFPTGIETQDLIVDTAATVYGDFLGKRISLRDPAHNTFTGIDLQPGVEASFGDTPIRAYTTSSDAQVVVDVFQNVFGNYTSRIQASGGGLEIDSSANISINAGSHHIVLSGDTVITPEVRASGLVSSGGVWIGSTEFTGQQVIDSNGNWVGPAISSSNTFDQGLNTTSTVSFANVTSTGQFFAKEGSYGNSGYTFTNDGGNDTGMFSNGDGYLQFYNNAVETVEATQNGWAFKQTTKFTGTNLNDVAFNQTKSFNSISGTNQQELDSWAVTYYSTVKYLIQIKDGSNIQIEEILLAYDGSNIYISKYGIITNNGNLGTFTADKTAGAGANVRLLFTPSGASNMSVRIHKTLMAV